MSISIVSTNLNQWAAASAIKAARANNPDSIKALQQAEARFLRLSALLQADMNELAQYRGIAAKKAATKARNAIGKAMIDCETFRASYFAACIAIQSVYGNWRIQAPKADIFIADIPVCWQSRKTLDYLGHTKTIRYSKIEDIPQAQYWPGGVIPDGLVWRSAYPAYAIDTTTALAGLSELWKAHRRNLQSGLAWRRAYREDGEDGVDYRAKSMQTVELIRAVRKQLRDAGTTPWANHTQKPHDAAWHKAHGYIQDGKGEWVFEIGYRNQQNRSDQIKINEAATLEANRERDNDRITVTRTSFKVQYKMAEHAAEARTWGKRTCIMDADAEWEDDGPDEARSIRRAA